jgi:hypothetical protein
VAAVVINHVSLNIPVDDLADVIDQKFGDVFLEQPGFQAYYLVKTAEREATMVIVWASEAEAEAARVALGPTLFDQYVTPHLAGPQDRRVGPVVAEASR